METKRELRKKILALRNEIPPLVREEKSRTILQTLYGMKLYQDADMILTYVDYQSEVITSPLLSTALTDRKQFFCPKVSGEEMEFYQITGMESLKEGYKGIKEPLPIEEQSFFYKLKMIQLKEIQPNILMLMPGAVFDRKHHRIGYGKGFYDRYLKQLSEMFKEYDIIFHTIALCYDCQMLNEIPYEEHDIRPEIILTENKIYKASRE